MKLRHYFLTAATALLALALGVVIFERASNRSRQFQIAFVTHQLALSIDTFRREHGYYPRTLTDLLTDSESDEKLNLAIRQLIDSTYTNAWHDTYSYTPSTNGFTILVSGPEVPPLGWFGRQRKVEQRFKLDPSSQ